MNATRYRKLLHVLDQTGQQLVPEPAHGRRQGRGADLRKNKYLLWFLSLSAVYSKQALFWPGSSSGDRQQSGHGPVSLLHSPTPELHLFQQSLTNWRIINSPPPCPLWPSVISLKLSRKECIFFFSSCAQYQFRNKMKFSFIRCPFDLMSFNISVSSLRFFYS